MSDRYASFDEYGFFSWFYMMPEEFMVATTNITNQKNRFAIHTPFVIVKFLIFTNINKTGFVSFNIDFMKPHFIVGIPTYYKN